MIDRVFGATFVTVLLLGCFAIIYLGVFYVTLSDDIEFSIGKKTLRSARKKYKGVWLKFLFLDFIRYVDKLHYGLFICFLVTFLGTVVCADLLIIFNKTIYRILFQCFLVPCLVSTALSAFARWKLYKGNVVRRRPKKRKGL